MATDEGGRRRPGWGTLIALLVAFAGSGLLAAHLFEDTLESDPRGPYIGALATSEDAGPARDAAAPRALPGLARPADPRGQDAVYDPQRTAMRLAFAREGDAGLALPFAPIVRAARLTLVRGTPRVAEGAACEVRVLPAREGPYDCAVRVLCAGEVLYPDAAQSAGYLPCELREGAPIGAFDDAPSAADQDPMLTLDLAGGTARVEEEGERAFVATLELLENMN